MKNILRCQSGIYRALRGIGWPPGFPLGAYFRGAGAICPTYLGSHIVYGAEPLVAVGLQKGAALCIMTICGRNQAVPCPDHMTVMDHLQDVPAAFTFPAVQVFIGRKSDKICQTALPAAPAGYICGLHFDSSPSPRLSGNHAHSIFMALPGTGMHERTASDHEPHLVVSSRGDIHICKGLPQNGG